MDPTVQLRSKILRIDSDLGDESRPSPDIIPDNVSEDSRRPDSLALQLTTITSLSELYLAPSKLNLSQNINSVQKLFLLESHQESDHSLPSSLASSSKSSKTNLDKISKNKEIFSLKIDEEKQPEFPGEPEEEYDLTLNVNPIELLDRKNRNVTRRAKTRSFQGVNSNFKKSNNLKKDEDKNFYRKTQTQVYEFLNHPQTIPSIFYHIILLTIMSIYGVVVMTTDKSVWNRPGCSIGIKPPNYTFRMWFEHILVIYCAFGFFLRLWSSRSLDEYCRVSTMVWLTSYFRHPSHMFDLVMLFASVSLSLWCWAPFTFELIQDIYTLLVLRTFHRLYSAAQWTTVRTRQSPWKLMAEVFREQRNILFGLFYLELALIVVMAYVVYMVETHQWSTVPVHQDVTITDLADALYWASITLATIGFGDLAPVTDIGKLITVICLMIGMALYALPSGIIATSLAIKISRMDELRARRKQRDLAARLIQRVWRLVRREKRFELARMLWAQHQLQNQPNHNQKEEGPRKNSKNNSKSSKKVIKLGQSLQKRIEKIVQRSDEYYACKFILLLQIEEIRTKFARICMTKSEANLRMTESAIQNDYRKLMSTLERSHLELNENMASMDTVFEQKLESIENRLRKMLMTGDFSKNDENVQTGKFVVSKTIAKHQMA